MNFFKKISLIALLALSVSACQTTVNKITDTSGLSHSQKVSQITKYKADGSFYYNLNSTKYYGRFYFDQADDKNYSLKFITTFGTTLFNLNVTSDVVKLIDHQSNVYTGKNVDKLMNQLTGMDFPFSVLHNLIKGDFKSIENTKDQSERVIQGMINQKTSNNENKLWNIDVSHYAPYQTKAFNVDLPEVFMIKNGNDSLRLTIKNWVL